MKRRIIYIYSELRHFRNNKMFREKEKRRGKNNKGEKGESNEKFYKRGMGS